MTHDSLPFTLGTSIVLFSNVHTNNFFLQKPENTTSQPPSNQQVVEVAIPHVGKFMIESKEGGYDDEVPLLKISALFLLMFGYLIHIIEGMHAPSPLCLLLHNLQLTHP